MYTIRLFSLPLIIFIAFGAGTSNADIYRWKDDDGKLHFSDKPSPRHSSDPVRLRVNTYQAVSYDTADINTVTEVVMYSASWCGVCKTARRYFQDNDIRFTEYDIEKSAQGRADYQRLGARGVPVILVGKQRMNGFSVEGFESLYR